ncbi:MAG TPA: HupE/UreJ family protein [Hyphomicrobiaceae bacterium]
MRCRLPIGADKVGSTRKGRAREHAIALGITGLGAVAGVLLDTCHPALAHSGLEHPLGLASGSFATGFVHPWTGLDHMLALLTVGLWAGLNGGRALWAWPATFVGAMLVGGALGIAGVFVPLTEPGILVSVVVLGLLVLTAARLPLALGAALIVLFALLHGHAHGAELPNGAAAGAYMAGFALATALLHAIGIAIAWVGRDGIGAPLVRAAGAAVAALGIALAVI